LRWLELPYLTQARTPRRAVRQIGKPELGSRIGADGWFPTRDRGFGWPLVIVAVVLLAATWWIATANRPTWGRQNFGQTQFLRRDLAPGPAAMPCARHQHVAACNLIAHSRPHDPVSDIRARRRIVAAGFVGAGQRG